MTYAQFREALRATPRRWVGSGGLFGTCIRIPVEHHPNRWCCPLTAIHPNGLRDGGTAWFLGAGADLGLDPDVTRAIADAADGTGEHFSIEMRRDLLADCGLQIPLE